MAIGSFEKQMRYRERRDANKERRQHIWISSILNVSVRDMSVYRQRIKRNNNHLFLIRL
jgi:hypothetical protein